MQVPEPVLRHPGGNMVFCCLRPLLGESVAGLFMKMGSAGTELSEVLP